MQHIHNLNNELSNYGKYAIVLPQTTRNDLDTKTEVDNAQLNLDRSLQELKKDFMVSTRNANQARKDLQNIQVMKTVIDSLAQVGLISSPSSEEIIKQAEGILILAYSNIKTNEPYIYISTMRKMRNYIRQQTLKLAHLVSYILTKYLVISSQEKYLLFSSFG